MKLVLLMAWVFVFAVSGFGQSKLASKVGIVTNTNEGSACLEIANSKLKAGQAVRIVMLEKPQSVKSTTIITKLRKSCLQESTQGSSYYSIRLSKKLTPFVGIAVVGPKVTVAKGTASGDLNSDGKKDYFRTCTSTEGAHLTVWSGRPLSGRRIWHGYYYIGYDTEQTCKEKDYK
ncbi:MAG: hypothetical protein ACKVQJ_14150 [Pyrinomonadaceae bacterium]